MSNLDDSFEQDNLENEFEIEEDNDTLIKNYIQEGWEVLEFKRMGEAKRSFYGAGKCSDCIHPRIIKTEYGICLVYIRKRKLGIFKKRK